MPNHTLLRLLRELKRRHSELITAPNAIFWNRLGRHVLIIRDRYYLTMAPKQYNMQFWDLDLGQRTLLDDAFKQKFDRVVKRVLGYTLIHVVQTPAMLWPSNDAKAYWHGKSLQWTPSARWEELKTLGYVRWCSSINDWASAETFVTVWELTKTKRPNSRLLSASKTNINLFTTCPVCARTWFRHFITDNPKTDKLACPLCQTKSKDNPPHTPNTIYGGYHSHRDSWEFQIQRTGTHYDRKSLPMGVELEMNLLNARRWSNPHPQVTETALNIYNEQQRFNPAWNNIYFERDGSLGHGGLEMITNPMTLAYHHQYWAKMLPVIREYCVGWYTNAHNGGSDNPYGIHITFHKKYWGDFRLARFIKFVENPANKNFIVAIAQRASMYGGYHLGTDHVRHITGYSQIQNGKIISSSRDRPVHVKGSMNLVEVRMFRSTLNQQSFLKNLEFIDAFLNWTKETPWSISFLDFLAWLGSKPHHFHDYANLLAYMTKDTFRIWGEFGIINTWKESVKQRKIHKFTQVQPTPTYANEDL